MISSTCFCLRTKKKSDDIVCIHQGQKGCVSFSSLFVEKLPGHRDYQQCAVPEKQDIMKVELPFLTGISSRGGGKVSLGTRKLSPVL